MGSRRRTMTRSCVAEFLRAERETRGITVTDMAHRLGVTRQNVQNVERSRSMTEDMMKRYADALGCVVVVSLQEKTT